METFHRPDSFQSHLKYFWNINKFRFIFPSVCIPLGPVDRDGAKKCFIRHGASSNRPVDALHRGSTEAPPRLHRGSTEAPSGGKRRKHKRSKTPAVGLLIGAGITWPHQASTEGVGGGRWGREGVGIKQQQRKITMTIFTWIISWLGLRDLLVSNLNQEEQR